MTLETRVVGRVAVIQVHGKMTGVTGEVRSAAIDAMSNGCSTVVVNIQDVPAIDSSGVGEFVSTSTSLRNRGGRLKVCNPSAKIESLFAITKLNTMLDIYKTEAEAIASAT